MNQGPLKLRFATRNFEQQLPTKINGLLPAAKQWGSGVPRRASAVCMLFIANHAHPMKPAEVVFIRRSRDLRSHRGQIGFPGGRRDAEDKSPAATALRELEEEIALPQEAVHICGALPVCEAIDATPVFPLIATTTYRPSLLQANSHEVASIILIPWTELTTSKCQSFNFNLFGVKRRSFLFPFEQHNVWGLTAKIVHSAAIAAFDEN